MPDILVIDDESGVRQIIRDTLELAGYRVDEANNGAVGLDKIKETLPSIVICDLKMPRLNGFEVLKAIRDCGEQFQDLSFIFLSGLKDKECIRAGYKIGADDFVTKPLDIDLLRFKVDAMMRKIRVREYRNRAQSTAREKITNGNEYNKPRGVENRSEKELSENFETKLQKAILSGGQVASGSCQFVGLGEFKEAFGPEWEQLRERAISFCEGIIHNELGPDDVYMRFGNAGFLMLFEGQDDKQAQSHVDRIAALIRKRLLGDSAGAQEHLQIETDVVNPRHYTDDRGNINTSSLMDVFQGREEERASCINSNDPSWFTRQLGKIYRPLWDVKRQVIVASQIYPTRDTSYGTLRGRACLHGGADDPLVIHLDCFLAEQAKAALMSSLRENTSRPISLPVHFRSLIDENYETLSEVLATVPESLRARQLSIEVVGVPESRDEMTFQHAIKNAQSFTKKVVVELPPEDRHAFVAKAQRIKTIKLEIDDVMDSNGRSASAARIKQFCMSAKSHYFEVRVDNIDCIESFEIARDLGAEVIGGRIIGRRMSAPMQPTFLSVSKILDK